METAVDLKNAGAVIDLFEAAGGKFRAIVKEFETAADAKGRISLAFRKGSVDFPKASAIEIIASGKVSYAINCGGEQCGTFAADSHFVGGNVV